jgi:acetyl-CoA carboxylase carboxyltransferase component
VAEQIAELQRRRERILFPSPEAVAKQRDQGKLTARERLELLLDPGSFVEVDQFVTHRCTNFGLSEVEIPGDGVVTGYGRIDGRTVFVFSQDFTTMGGTLGEMHARKICKIMDMAAKARAPVIGINDSGGARIQEGVDALNGYGEIFRRNTLLSGVVPQISVVLGPCAGGAVYSPALTDLVFMVEGISKMFITGPQVVKAVTREEVTAETLGGSRVHAAQSGVAHFVTKTEEECLRLVRKVLSYLPSHGGESPPRATPVEPLEDGQRLEDLVPADPKIGYDVRAVITRLVDAGSFLELQPDYATNIVCGFARLNGYSIGVIANQPRFLAGCLDINASDKAARFVRFCDAFNLGLLTLVDTTGYLPGKHQEHGGIIRHGAKLLYAYSEATVPKLTVILRKAYGGAYLAMCSRALGADQVFAWPGAEIAVMGPDGAADIIFRKEISSAPDSAKAREQKVEEYRRLFASPYVAASRGYVDAVIAPAETRAYLCQALKALQQKYEERPRKKHGNIPL